MYVYIHVDNSKKGTHQLGQENMVEIDAVSLGHLHLAKGVFSKISNYEEQANDRNNDHGLSWKTTYFRSLMQR